MRKEQIVIGTLYVNERRCLAREVIAEIDDRRVLTNSFDLRSGALAPTRRRLWSRSDLARWADREATAPEVARVHRFQEETWNASGHVAEPEERPTIATGAALGGVPGHHTFPPGK